jgi:hypothetical protein
MRFFLNTQEEVMDPQNKNDMADERTEEYPAQEKVASSEEAATMLPAEQVYAERLGETDKEDQAQGFIP